jgi:hypothetical protein
MRTVSNYKALARVEGGRAAQIKSLVQAVALDLALPQLCLEASGPMGAYLAKSVHLLASNDPRRAPDLTQFKGALARKWVVPSDTPILSDVAPRVESFWHTNMPEIDLGWMNLFHLVDMVGSAHDTFDLTDTNAGVVWEQQKPGGKTKPRHEITESSTPVKFLAYTTGIGILDDWLEYQKFWKIEEVVNEYRSTAWDLKAQLHYGLFTALGAGINQAFATNDPTTFNNAAAAILRNVRTKGYAAGMSAQFWILCSAEHLGRVNLMLEATQGSALVAHQSGMQPISYSVAGVIASTHVPANSTGYYLVLPNRKIQRGNWKDLTTTSVRDEYTRAEDILGLQKFNAIIGDSDQVRRVLFS